MSENIGEKDGHNGHFEQEETDVDEISESPTPTPTHILKPNTTTPKANLDKKSTSKMVRSDGNGTTGSSHHQQSHQKIQSRPQSSHKNSSSRPKSAKNKKPQKQEGKLEGQSGSRSSSNEQKHVEFPNNSDPESFKNSKTPSLKTSSSSDAKDGPGQVVNKNLSKLQERNGQQPESTTSLPNKNNNHSKSEQQNPKATPTFDNSKSKGKKKTLSSATTGEKPSRLSVTVPLSPFESGSNTECIQLLRQLWNVHEEAVQFLGQIRIALSQLRQQLRDQENYFESTLREKRHSNANSSSTGNLAGGSGSGPVISGGLGGGQESERNDGWVHLQIFIDGLKCISDNVSDIEKQYATLSTFQPQCKVTLFAKVLFQG